MVVLVHRNSVEVLLLGGSGSNSRCLSLSVLLCIVRMLVVVVRRPGLFALPVVLLVREEVWCLQHVDEVCCLDYRCDICEYGTWILGIAYNAASVFATLDQMGESRVE